jgi:hypothetical protein
MTITMNQQMGVIMAAADRCGWCRNIFIPTDRGCCTSCGAPAPDPRSQGIIIVDTPLSQAQVDGAIRSRDAEVKRQNMERSVRIASTILGAFFPRH